MRRPPPSPLAALAREALAVFAADWTLITCTGLWAALFGEPAQPPAKQRNLVLETFLPEPTGRLPQSERGQEAMEAALVADLRTAQETVT